MTGFRIAMMLASSFGALAWSFANPQIGWVHAFAAALWLFVNWQYLQDEEKAR